MAELSSLLKDSPLGRFWLPGQVDQQVPGVIVERNGTLLLELIEPLPERSPSCSAGVCNFYPVICGWLSRGGSITLFNCPASTNENIPGNEWERCSFAFAIQGQPLENTDVFLFNKANVQLTGLVEWTGFNGLQQGWQEDTAVHGGRTWTASYALPEPRVYQSDADLTIKLLATFHKSSVGRFRMHFLQDAEMEVALNDAVSFAELESKVHGIRQLLMLLSGLELRPTWNHVGHVSDEDALPVFRNHAPRPSSEPANPELRTFVPFEDISVELPELFSKWVGVQKAYGDAVATGLFTPYLSHTNATKISNLVNCLVRYAEAEGGKKVPVSAAVDEAVRRYRPNVPGDFISSVKDTIEKTRHYYTHFNPDKKEIAADGAELANLVDFLDVINRCVLMEKLGLKRDRVIQWIHGSREYSKRLRMERFKELGA